MRNSVHRSIAVQLSVALFALTFAACGPARSEEGTVMTLSDLGIDVGATRQQPVPQYSVPETTVVSPSTTAAVSVDPLIYNENGSLYTGPMPDGTYCVNGRVTAGGAPSSLVVGGGTSVVDPGVVYYQDSVPGAVVVESPGVYYDYRDYHVIDPDYERHWGNNVWLPGYNRWDLYRYRPDRRPYHRPDRYRDRGRDRPRPPDRIRPEGPPRHRPEGPRPPRPPELRPDRRPRPPHGPQRPGGRPDGGRPGKKKPRP